MLFAQTFRSRLNGMCGLPDDNQIVLPSTSGTNRRSFVSPMLDKAYESTPDTSFDHSTIPAVGVRFVVAVQRTLLQLSSTNLTCSAGPDMTDQMQVEGAWRVNVESNSVLQ